MVPMIIAVNVSGSLVGSGLGRAKTIAIATVEDSQILSWEEFDVGWDVSHDQMTVGRNGQPSHGSHHGAIVSFMKQHHVEAVITGHAGPPMAHTLDLMGIRLIQNVVGDAKQAVLNLG